MKLQKLIRSNAYKTYDYDYSIMESMADEYGRQGQFDKVQEFGEKALTVNTTSYHTYEILANVYALKKDIPRSLQMYDKAIALDSTVGNVYFNRGVTLVESNPAKAIEDYNKALSLPAHGKNYKIRVSRAYAYLKLNKYKEAIEDYTYGIENTDENPSNYYADRGIAKFNMQDKAGAITDLKQAISLDQNNKVAQENLTLIMSAKW